MCLDTFRIKKKTDPLKEVSGYKVMIRTRLGYHSPVFGGVITKNINAWVSRNDDFRMVCTDSGSYPAGFHFFKRKCDAMDYFSMLYKSCMDMKISYLGINNLSFFTGLIEGKFNVKNICVILCKVVGRDLICSGKQKMDKHNYADCFVSREIKIVRNLMEKVI